MLKYLIKIIKKNNKGYSLLGLVIVIGITSMILASSIDTYQAEIMRSKEEEFIFRGDEMARAIAKFNHFGILLPLQLGAPFPTKLEDLGKLATLNGKKVIYVRKFAMKDILAGDGEWLPVRAGDPRILDYLKAWAEYNKQQIPPNYLQLAGFTTTNGDQNGLDGNTDKEEEEDDDEDDEDDDEDDEDDDKEKPNTIPSNGVSNNNVQGSLGVDSTSTFTRNNAFENIDDSSRPIIGVVSSSKRKAFRRLYGKEVNYNKWLFIFMPPPQPLLTTTPPQQQGENQEQN